MHLHSYLRTHFPEHCRFLAAVATTSFELTANTSLQKTHLHCCCFLRIYFICWGGRECNWLWLWKYWFAAGFIPSDFFFTQVINIALAFTMKRCLTPSNNAFLFPVNSRKYFYMPFFFPPRNFFNTNCGLGWYCSLSPLLSSTQFGVARSWQVVLTGYFLFSRAESADAAN